VKNNIYIFSNSVLSRKNDSLILNTLADTEPLNKIDIFEDKEEHIILPPAKSETNGSSKHIPAESVESIYTFGEVRFNTQLFKCLNNYSIPVHIFNYYGNYIGSFMPVNHNGSGDIQLLQYSAYLNQNRRIYIAKKIIESSLKNILTSLKAYTYTGLDLDEQINTISAYIEQVRFAETIQELMGFEGQVRNIYYESWQKILKQQNDFYRRMKNPPVGTVNSLISFGNSLLYAVCFSEIYRTRLSPFIGFIHEVGDNKHPLTYDLSEIFKPVIVDKVIFRVINLNIIQPDDFKPTEKGLYLKDNARKKFVEEFEKRLSTVILHKRINRRLSFRSLIRMECYNLINYLNGKLKSYDPYRAN
jgi:CRISPR-associated protein Cas1